MPANNATANYLSGVENMNERIKIYYNDTVIHKQFSMLESCQIKWNPARVRIFSTKCIKLKIE